VFEELKIASLPCSDGYFTTLQTISLTIPQGALHLRPYINFYFLNIFLHNRRQFSVEVLMINGFLAYGQQNCKGHCDSMLGSLSSLGELVKLFIILFSEDSTQNKLGLTQVFHFGTC